MRLRWLLWMLLVPASMGQYVTYGFNQGAAAAIVLDPAVTPCVNESVGSSVQTITCSLTSITAGDLLICFPSLNSEAGAHFVSVSDSLNSATFNSLNYLETGGPLNVGAQGIVYFANSASGSDTITLNADSAQTFLSNSCAAFKNVRTTTPIDSGAINVINAKQTAANPSIGTAQTPSAANELVIGEVQTTSATTPTAGSGFTVVGNQPNNTQVPEYKVQTTATATSVPYVAASDTWTELSTAFIPSSGAAGVDALTGIWNNAAGGSNGATPTTTTIGNSGTNSVGGTWSITNTHSDLTFTSGQTLNCQQNNVWINGTSYAGSGTLVYKFATGTGGDAINFHTSGGYTSISVAYCFETSIPQNDTNGNAYSLGVIQSNDSVDSCNPQILPTGSILQMALESAGGGASASKITFSTNVVYEIQLQYVTSSGGCQMAMYDTSGAQVGSTITNTSKAGSHPAGFIGIAGTSGAESESAAHAIWTNYARVNTMGTFPQAK